MAFLFGAATLAIDVGYLRYKQRVQQSATDSAAMAGANELTYTPPTRVISGAKMDATLNGYTTGGNVIVTVNNPPMSGPYTGVATAVEVIIKNTEPVFFWGIFGVNNQPITTRAVAALNPNQLGCVYALDKNGSGITLNGNGGPGIYAPNCGVVSNANLTINGGCITALFIGYVANLKNTSCIPPPEASPTQISIPADDPCKKYPACAYLLSLDVNTVSCVDNGGGVNLSALPPGRYCNKNTFKNATSVTFAPTAASALYIFDGAGFPTAANLSAIGATVYNNTGKGIIWNGNVNVKVTAPTTGPTSGMVYFQPASNSGSVIKNGFSGNVEFDGGFYAPTATVTMNGNVPSVSLFVAGSIVTNGKGMTVAGSPGLVQVGHPVLAE